MIILISRDVNIYRQLYSLLRRLSCSYFLWEPYYSESKSGYFVDSCILGCLIRPSAILII